MSKRIVIALGGNALGNTLPEQAEAVKITAKAIVDLIEDGNQVVVAHGNGPQVGIINNAMSALQREDPSQGDTPLSVCGAMSQAYIGYDLQNALREELLDRGIRNMPVCSIVTQVEVDPKDPAFDHPTKPIGKFMSEEEAMAYTERTGYLVREEVVLPGQSGILDLSRSEGEKVGAGQAVARVYRNTQAQEDFSEIQRLQLEIELLEYAASQGVEYLSAAKLDEEIIKSMAQLRACTAGGGYAQLDRRVMEVKSSVLKREYTFGDDLSADDLTDRAAMLIRRIVEA